jgi:predicted ATPase
MIQSVYCKNFQSLKDLEIELGKFTVIVGASSSGKSAFIRALRAIADNALHSDNIMQGTKHASVAVTTESATITIERSVGGTSVYKVAQHGSEESSYTKLNRQVPAQVTAALGIVPSTKEVTSINFASQHDAPYLLTESSGNAARILGELTNVSTIFAAVREASKRAKAASTLLNVRKKDQEAVIASIVEYKDINTQAKAMQQVEDIWGEAQALEESRQALQSCIVRSIAASEALSEVSFIPETPSLDEILDEQKTLQEFKALLKQAILATKQISTAANTIQAASAEILEAEKQLHDLLTDAGQCPLCLQEVN